MFKGLSIIFLAAGFTLISLVSCSGITRPCVSCEREIASDPYAAAEEARWVPEETKKKREREQQRMYRERHNL